jgi:hypothetical protein
MEEREDHSVVVNHSEVIEGLKGKCTAKGENKDRRGKLALMGLESWQRRSFKLGEQ